MMSHINVNTLVSEEASVAKVEVTLAGFHRTVTGAAKKHPNDPPVDVVGEALALSRAFTRVAGQLEAYAMETNAKHIQAMEIDKLMGRLSNFSNDVEEW